MWERYIRTITVIGCMWKMVARVYQEQILSETCLVLAAYLIILIP